MSQQTSAFEPTIRRLERHAAASIMHGDTDLVAVIQGCDFSTAEVYTTGEHEWDAHYGYDPMVRAFCCKELAGFTTEELHEYLADAERARALGFDPAQSAAGKTAPGRTTLGRAWRERFPERLKTFIQPAAERILAVAHEMEKTIRGETVTVTPTLVEVPSNRKEDATVTFVTNLAVDDATKNARGRTRRVMRRYARRWGDREQL